MDIANSVVWQVGAGDKERRYDEICLKRDVMMIGPGDLGPWDEKRYASHPDRNVLTRFCDEAKRGDVVLLRLGTDHVLAVGEIADDSPAHVPEFGDIDGWRLQHVRRVRWFPDTEKSDFPIRTFGGMANRFARVYVQPVLEWLASLDVPDAARRRRLARMPGKSNALTSSELAERLFIEGLPSEHIERLSRTLDSVNRVALWYSNEDKRPEGRPSEHETITYLVVPLLFSLGWSEQTAALEWRNVDVALFRRMPTTDTTLECVIEAKLLGSSIFRPVGQASKYAEGEGRSNCRLLVVTDGIRYAVFHRKRGGFVLHSHLNILEMRDSYPVLSCGGAVQAIMALAKDSPV